MVRIKLNMVKQLALVDSKLILTKNKDNDKVNGKLFLIVKSGPGFMDSWIIWNALV
jgi:hypothetical protein